MKNFVHNSSIVRRVGSVVVAVFALGVLLLFADTTGVTGLGEPVENRQPTLGFNYVIALQGTFPGDDAGTPDGTSPPNRTPPFLGEIKAVAFNFAPQGYTLCQGQLLSIAQNTALWTLIGTTYGGNGVTTFALPDLQNRVPIGAGQGSGLPDYPLGTVVGADSRALTVDNLPSHTHTLPGGGNTDATGSGASFDNRQASLALNFLIGSNGEIIIVSWPREPAGWAHCDGRLLPLPTYNYLFGNIGTAFGGDGTTTVGLPDTRGRVIIGEDGGVSWPIGLNYGSNDVVLGVSDIPAHTHTTSAGDTGSTGGAGNSANNYQPSLVMRRLIAFSGIFPSRGGAPLAPTPNGASGSFPLIGEIYIIAGQSADGLMIQPGDWQPLYGALYSKTDTDNMPLYSLIGTTYGGDGVTTFGVPDMRGIVPAGFSSFFVIGEIGGRSTLSMVVQQLAAHSHSFTAPSPTPTPTPTPTPSPTPAPTPVTVTSVTSTTADGTYGIGAPITITVTFSGPVTVTGTPQLALNSGGTASYSSGSPSSTLTFTYTVAGGQNSADLDYTSATALSLNGGTINDASANPANLTLPAPGSAGSIGGSKNIVIDTTAPTVTSVTSTTANGTYSTGAVITITVGFSEPVNVTGTPQLALNSGGTASYSANSGTNTLTFTYTVAAGQNSADLDYTSTTALSLNGGTIRDTANNNADLTLPAPGSAGSIGGSKNIVINTAEAVVTNVTSMTADGTYGIGAVISIQITFSETVNVTGTPQLALNSGGTASYSAGSPNSTLTFTYSVAAGQNSADLDYTSTSALSLNGGTINDANSTPANLTLPAPGAAGSLGFNKNIVIDTSTPPPQALAATINDTVTGTGLNQWDYGSSGWFFYNGANISSAYQGDEHYAFTTNVVAHFRFHGTQVKIYTVKEPHGGIIGYTLDNLSEVPISNYAPTIMGNTLSYTSPIVADGDHDLVIRVTGMHENASDANAITVDKAEVYVPPGTSQVLSATVNDTVTGNGPNQWDYGQSGWFFYNGADVQSAYQGDEHYAFTTNVVAHFRFSGTQVKIYTVKEPHGGIIGYSLDGGMEVPISNYSPTIMGNTLSYTSPMVADGIHDLVIRVTGMHENASDSNAITVDKAEVFAPPPQMLTATINDTVTGMGNNQWDYGSMGWFFYNGANISSAYQGDEHYAFTTNVTGTFRFTGTQVKIYTVKESAGGNIGYSLDGNPEVVLSNYSSTIMGNTLSFVSPVVASGPHTLVIRVVGTHEPASSGKAITVDKAEVYDAP